MRSLEKKIRLVVVVDLVVDVLARVHMEAGVQEGAIAERLLSMLGDDLLEVELVASFVAIVVAPALAFGSFGAELLHLIAVGAAEALEQVSLFGSWFTEQLEQLLAELLALALLGRGER